MIRIVVVSRLRLYRDGLAGLFAEGPNVVCAVASGAEDGLARIREHEPDLALVALDGDLGAQFVRDVAAASPATHVVVVGIDEDDPRVVPLAEAGVAGYVTIEASADEVVRAVESVARGETLCSPKLTATLLRRVASLAREQRPARALVSSLTAREQEIVALIDRGLSNKEIAHGLSIEVATVKNHVHNILEKLNVTRRAEAAALLRRRI
jgi:DNA-binding NarL/FixJ family response regulator